jgi:hypothetical protein
MDWTFMYFFLKIVIIWTDNSCSSAWGLFYSILFYILYFKFYLLFNIVYLYCNACDRLCVTFYGQILYPALLGNNWIYEMYYYNNNNNNKKCFAQETNTEFLRLWANKNHNCALFAAMWFSS